MGRHKATKEQKNASKKLAQEKEVSGEKIKVPSLKKVTTKKQLTPDERERLRNAVVAHFGKSYVERRLVTCINLKEISECLKQMFNLMQKQVDEARKEAEEYMKGVEIEHRRVSRPKSEFNWRECAYLCSIGCTRQEIAGFFQIHPETLQKYVKEEYGFNFTDYYEKHSQGLKVSLRRAQMTKALEGDANMLKFLGKNYLGQKDKVDFDGEVKGANTFADLVTGIQMATAVHKTKEQIEEDERAVGAIVKNDSTIEDDI